MPVVSLIIPVYHAEKYLRRCLDSALQQTFSDMEIIVVNDGSEDASLEICREYEAKDSRFHVLDKENTGVSDSRNRAIAMAQGEYLQFLDSDDWLAPDATESLVYAARKYDCDLVIADFYRVDGAVFTEKQHIREHGLLTREQYAAYMMQEPDDFYYGVLWNKLYRRSVIEEHQIRMNPELRWCEDFLFNLSYIRYAERFTAIQTPIYYYYEENELPSGYSRVSHGFEPVYDGNSRILVLGSFPSVKSRENSFYYGHPQNRFWKLMARLLDEPVPSTIEEKKLLLLSRGIAIWDVVAACDIKGSSDSSIRNVIPADINRVLRAASITTIIANGDTAYKLYRKYCEPHTGREAVKCPSTSPANAIFTLDRLTEAWGKVLSGNLL